MDLPLQDGATSAVGGRNERKGRNGQPGALFTPLESGLVGCERWTHALEGPFTRLAKLTLINVMPPSELCPLLFGRRLRTSHARRVHGNSLLDTSWVAHNAPPLGMSLVEASLDRATAKWYQLVASDQRLRFCQECADVGFQSALHQIDALACCPLHGSRLLDACHQCAAPTPRYALTPEGFERPMCCNTCGRPYGKAWEWGLNLERCSSPIDDGPFRALWSQLQRCDNLDISWPEVSRWHQDPRSPEPERDLRAAVFRTLSQVAPTGDESSAPSVGQPSTCPPVEVRHYPCELPNPREEYISTEDVQERVAVYKSIRRRFTRLHGLHHELETLDPSETFYSDWNTDAKVPVTSASPAELHALVLWRHRFEEQFVAEALERSWRSLDRAKSSLKLRKRLLCWPLDWRVDARTWGHFVHACLVEDLWTARRWQACTSSLGDPLSSATARDDAAKARRATYLEHFTTWQARMSIKLQAWPQSVTHLLLRPEHNSECSGDLRLVVARVIRNEREVEADEAV